MIIFLVGAFLLLGYYFLISYYHHSWLKVPLFEETEPLFDSLEKITVIIPARNEEAAIANCLDALLQQSYPTHLLEIIVVDDHSTDNTALIVQRYHERVKLIDLETIMAGQHNSTAYKKKALESAIGIASGTSIVTTDADCIAEKDWIATIAAFHQQTKAVFIVAPVRITPVRSFISVFQSMDFAILQGITAASVNTRFHNMCNGANLCYEREAFYAVNGFEDINHIASGDDMLLMDKINKKYPNGIAYLNSQKAIVQTTPVPDWHSFLHQRIRWASKSGHYKDRRMPLVLLLVYLVNVALLILLTGSIFRPEWFVFFCIALFYKIIIEWGFVKDVLRYFSLSRLLPLFPVFQPFHIIYTVVAGFLGLFSKYEWKGRKVK